MRTTGARIALRVGLVVVLVAETFALSVARVPSPVLLVADLLLGATPGTLATWFLATFRGAARPLLLAAATLVVLGVSVTAVAGLRSVLHRAGWAARDPRDGADLGPEGDGGGRALDRRLVLQGSAALLLGIVVVRAGTALRMDRVVDAGRALIARDPLPPVAPDQDLSPTVAGLSAAITPIASFYRIDTSLRVLTIDLETWRLRIHGLVEQEVELSFDDLIALGLEEHDVTLSCVSNEVGGGLVGTGRWLGVPLERVVALAGPLPEGEQLVGRSVDGWTAGFPTELHRTPGALVAVGMNGETLPYAHGWPARLVVPGLYGYVSATKWLTGIELTTWDGFDGFWVERLWAKEAPVKLTSRVDVPPVAARISAGPTRAAGVAWGPLGGVSRVEVRVDDGEWQEATLSRPLGRDTWVQWYADVTVPPGRHDIEVRAYDGEGGLQSGRRRAPLPDGAEGWHRRSVRAT